MKFDPMIAFISFIAGLFPVGAVSAFFLYVSPLTILSVMAIVLTMMLMFALGLLLAEESKTGQKTGSKQATTTKGPAAPVASATGPFFYRPE